MNTIQNNNSSSIKNGISDYNSRKKTGRFTAIRNWLKQSKWKKNKDKINITENKSATSSQINQKTSEFHKNPNYKSIKLNDKNGE